MFERIFEKLLWNTRFFVVLPVIFGLLGAIVLFIIASVDIFEILKLTYSAYFGHAHPEHMHEEVVSAIIGAVDLYLIAVVLLIFSFGLYELFISEIDEAKNSTSNILQIHSLDQLKDKLAKVIIMVLIVSFFQRVLHMQFNTPLEMLYLAISILVLSLGLYFLHKGGSH
jgi:uncharacterized membrane protein YqhA